MTFSELINYLEENIGIDLLIAEKRIEGPNFPNTVAKRIQDNNLKTPLGYVQPRVNDKLGKIQIVYFLHESKFKPLIEFQEKYIGVENNWKHPDIIHADSNSMHNIHFHKSSDIITQVLTIEHRNEPHKKSKLVHDFGENKSLNLLFENEFDYQEGLDKSKSHLLHLIIKDSKKDELSVRFLSKDTKIIEEGIGNFEGIYQHLLRRKQTDEDTSKDWEDYKGVDYDYKII